MYYFRDIDEKLQVEAYCNRQPTGAYFLRLIRKPAMISKFTPDKNCQPTKEEDKWYGRKSR